MTLPLNRTSILFRLSLADLEGDAVSYRTSQTGMSGGSTSDDVIAKSSDVTTCKSVDLTESLKASLDPTNYISQHMMTFSMNQRLRYAIRLLSHMMLQLDHMIFSTHLMNCFRKLTSRITMISKKSMTRNVMSLPVHTT